MKNNQQLTTVVRRRVRVPHQVALFAAILQAPKCIVTIHFPVFVQSSEQLIEDKDLKKFEFELRNYHVIAAEKIATHFNSR